MKRVILHCDLNNFYASVECLYNPELRGKPVAVCGSIEDRHGIVLAKNYVAKKYKVRTGETVWEAKSKCPGWLW
ncbi:DNA polymerase IV [Acetivibrio straminisolvens JCM 21531]|uniref:DNA polymerase IV n=1 Tax=Acetivibrio straminisolvens JCM 21531 TaxID=1294263 RepID=W4VCP3_9FIRM|nr:DNA polymerase IV [Acetivibrio straminisolvens JCM 21531]